MSNLFNEKNTKTIYLSQERVPIINVHGIWFEEKDVLDFTDDDEENYNQFLKDIAPKPIADNSNIICLSGVINAMPPLVRNINSENLKIEDFAPIKAIPYEKEHSLVMKGYRSGTRSSILKAKVYTKEEFDKLENKNKVWVIARHNNKIYIPDDDNGDVLIRLKGCSMWTQKNQNEYVFPNVLLRDCKCYRNDVDYSKKYIEVRGFNSVNGSARELYGLREVKPYFDKLNILIGNSPLGFWKYINLKNDPSPNIEKCVCVMETIGDKRVETHFISGSEKMLYDIIDEDKCKDLVNRINEIYLKKDILPPSDKNTTFSRAVKLPLYDMGGAILKKRYTFDIAMENFDEVLEGKGFIDSKLVMENLKDYGAIYTMALIYAEIGYEAGRILSTIHRTGNNWGTYFNDDIRLIDSNAHGDNLIILEKNKVQERYEKEKVFQFISMVDLDQIVKPEISISVWEGEIKRNPRVATEYFWVELESLGNDLGGIASEGQFFKNIPKREKPDGIYCNLLYILRDCLIYELMKSYIDPLRKRHYEKDLDVENMYELIEKGMILTINNEA